MGQLMTRQEGPAQSLTTSELGPLCTCSCSKATCQYRIGAARYEITKRLRDLSLKDLNEGRNRFIPRGALLEIFSEERLCNYLHIFFGLPRTHNDAATNRGTRNNALGADVKGILNYVCPGNSGCRACEDALCTGGRVIFATLVLMGFEAEILRVLNTKSPQNRICDAKLRHIVADISAGIPKKMPYLFKSWDVRSRELFCHLQWRMVPPFFKKFKPAEMEPHQELDDAVSLPWTSIDTEGENDLQDGEFGYVRKIEIHPDQHTLGTHGQCFALKTLKPTLVATLVKTHFADELSANRFLKSHDGIVPLLHAFEHRRMFCLIFPWADGGNLFQLWERTRPLRNIAFVDWVWDQCAGLAAALAAMHECRMLHCDIKPENILCFSLPDGGMGQPVAYRLKLADFGISKRLGTGAHIDPGSWTGRHIPTQRPPEVELNPEHVGLEADTWSLGCLYLDFITWLLLDFKGVKAFIEERLEEADDPEGSEVDGGTIECDTYYKVVNTVTARGHDFKTGSMEVTREAQHKTAVTEHIKHLKKHGDCNDRLRDFLNFIQSSMFVVDPKARKNSTEIHQFLLTGEASTPGTKKVKRRRPRRGRRGGIPGLSREGSSAVSDLSITGRERLVIPLQTVYVVASLTVCVVISMVWWFGGLTFLQMYGIPTGL